MSKLAAEIISLDKLLSNENVDFIKMDIEGMEEDALFGAKNLIKTCRPLLAISCYHTTYQYMTIPSIIDSIVEHEYYYLMRHYKYTFDDTIFYAIPKEKMLKQ